MRRRPYPAPLPSTTKTAHHQHQVVVVVVVVDGELEVAARRRRWTLVWWPSSSCRSGQGCGGARLARMEPRDDKQANNKRAR